MMTLFGAPMSYTLAAPWARLMIADVMAARRSAFVRSSVLDMAINSPSEETAIASITSDVFAANWLSSQLNRCASLLSGSVFAVI
jgi:hypothetical protein